MSLRWVDTTSTCGTIVDTPWRVVDRTAMTDTPPTDRDAPAQKSECPPMAAITRPSTRSRLTGTVEADLQRPCCSRRSAGSTTAVTGHA